MGNDRSTKRKMKKMRGEKSSKADVVRQALGKAQAFEGAYQQQHKVVLELQARLHNLRGVVIALLVEAGPVCITPKTLDALNAGTYKGWDDRQTDEGVVLFVEEVKVDDDKSETGTPASEPTPEGEVDSEGPAEADHSDLDAG